MRANSVGLCPCARSPPSSPASETGFDGGDAGVARLERLALALADGRCVSLGVNGSIWVWDLEAGSGTEVSSGIPDVSEDEDDDERAEAWEGVLRRLASGARGTVVFDDRRIVSASGPVVEVRRFDI